MIKLNAHVSKKVPMPDVDYSSQNFSAGMEIEVSSSLSEEELREKYRTLYKLLASSIEEQIQDAAAAPQQAPRQTPSPQRETVTARQTTSKHGGNGSDSGGSGSNGHDRTATEAQVRAIYAIAHEHGYSDQDIRRKLSDSYGVRSPKQLAIGDASSVIDTLKNNGKG